MIKTSPCHSEKMKLYMLISAVFIFMFSFVQGVLHVMSYCSNTHTGHVRSGIGWHFFKDSVNSYNIKKKTEKEI